MSKLIFGSNGLFKDMDREEFRQLLISLGFDVKDGTGNVYFIEDEEICNITIEHNHIVFNDSYITVRVADNANVFSCPRYISSTSYTDVPSLKIQYMVA